jgi:hypothetical protein
MASHNDTPAIQDWIRLLNTQDDTLAKALLHQDVLVLAYQEGLGGPVTHYAGCDAVCRWVNKPPYGRFRFHVLWVKDGQADPRLPDAGKWISSGYRVEHTESDFINEGSWLLGLEGGQIVGIIHKPMPLNDPD